MKDAALPFAGRTVTLALSARDYGSAGPPERDAVIRELESLGCRALRVVDGDPAGLECDLLILYRNCRTLRHYPKLLMRRPENRPRTAMWQIDPLPPRVLDRRLEGQALRLAELFAHRRLLRPLEILVSWPLYSAIAKRGLGSFSDPKNGYFVDPPMARTTVETYAAIRRGVAEGWLDRAYVSTVGKQRFLSERGIDAGFAPFGVYQGLADDRHLTRDIDVLFIGTLRKRHRRDALPRIMREIGKTGARVEVVGGGVYGNARIELLKRTRVVLHIHKYPWDTPWIRWTMAAANGALMVSEPLTDPTPFEPGVHYFEAPVDELPATVAGLLANPELLQATATRCRDFVRERFTLRGSLEAMLSDFFAPRPEERAT